MGKRGPPPWAWAAVAGSVGDHFSRPNGRSSPSKRLSDLEVKPVGINGEGLKTGKGRENSCRVGPLLCKSALLGRKVLFRNGDEGGLSPGKADSHHGNYVCSKELLGFLMEYLLPTLQSHIWFDSTISPSLNQPCS